jgi:hypothetical protein
MDIVFSVLLVAIVGTLVTMVLRGSRPKGEEPKK